MPDPIICAIDPGLSGALFLMRADGSDGASFDMPITLVSRNGKQKKVIDAHALAELLKGCEHVFVEQQWDRPGMNARFALGEGYGIARGVLAALGVPYTLVSPMRWKKALDVPRAKQEARARASQLMPAYASCWPLKKHDGRAEAALLALYGLSLFKTARSANA